MGHELDDVFCSLSSTVRPSQPCCGPRQRPTRKCIVRGARALWLGAHSLTLEGEDRGFIPSAPPARSVPVGCIPLLKAIGPFPFLANSLSLSLPLMVKHLALGSCTRLGFPPCKGSFYHPLFLCEPIRLYCLFLAWQRRSIPWILKSLKIMTGRGVERKVVSWALTPSEGQCLQG